MKIVLIGFMGSGKSSVAKELSNILKLKQIDMDEMVLKKTRCQDMDEVFACGGELLLRETEIEIAKELSLIYDVVIATGGGVVMNKIVLDYLKMNGGKVIFLDTDFETICQRLSNDNTPRPLFKNLVKAKELFDFRQILYRRYADEIVKTENQSINQIVKKVISLFY